MSKQYQNQKKKWLEQGKITRTQEIIKLIDIFEKENIEPQAWWITKELKHKIQALDNPKDGGQT